MTDPVDRLLSLFELDDLGDDSFEVPNPDLGFGNRVFGGQVAAQALRAATSTVDVDHRPHSLHAYFLRPGTPGVPIRFEVERTRDGRSFTTRRVLASQARPETGADPPAPTEPRPGREVIFEMSVSFHTVEHGLDYQLDLPADLPDPDEAPPNLMFISDSERDRLPMEMKELGRVGPDERGFYESTRRAWMRVKRRLPDDPVLHECVLTYFSDMGAVFGAIAPVPDQPMDRLMGASLDHALWFHRPIRADEWLLYDLRALSNAGARGFATGTMHAVDGTLGVSIAQEALIRVVDPARHG